MVPMSTHAMMAGVAVPDWVVERLERAGCVPAPEEAEEMVGAAPDAATLAGWVERRERGEPLAWIPGTAGVCARAAWRPARRRGAAPPRRGRPGAPPAAGGGAGGGGGGGPPRPRPPPLPPPQRRGR